VNELTERRNKRRQWRLDRNRKSDEVESEIESNNQKMNEEKFFKKTNKGMMKDEKRE
jgi:hypothetical protein